MVNETGRNTVNLLVVVALMVGTAACDDGVLADDDGVVYLTPWGGDSVQAVDVVDTAPTLTEENEANAEMLMANFEEQAEILLERPGVEDILGQIEQAYMLSGNYPDLVQIYRDQYERHGTDSIAAVALAWTHIQLGNEVALVEMERKLIEERPDDPLTWVVVGEANMRRAGQSMEAAERARDAFERVLALDPNFEGFKSLNRFRLDEQLNRLNAEVPEEGVDDDVQAADVPMHHAGGAEVTASSPDVEGVDSTEDDDSRREAAERRAQEIAEEAIEDTAVATAENLDAAGAPNDGVDPPDDGERQKQKARQYVLRAQQAFQHGGERRSEAQELFERALEYDADNIDARIGLLRVDERKGGSRAELSGVVDDLAQRSLTASQAYELGLFCLRSLNDRDRATSLLERVEQKDPSFARRVGVDSLLDP